MKNVFTILLLTICTTLCAQSYNIQNGFVAEGYDVVSYFTAKAPKEGKKQFQTTYDGAKFQFSSAKNLQLFTKNPTKYVPQYHGYCAFAIAVKNKKMSIDAESYDIKDGKLYLFYKSWFGRSKLREWKEGDTEALQKKGDENWEKLKHKK
ncbi:MAG: YHS domain-containing (seleno)protein [Polaribacter sp.]